MFSPSLISSSSWSSHILACLWYSSNSWLETCIVHQHVQITMKKLLFVSSQFLLKSDKTNICSKCLNNFTVTCPCRILLVIISKRWLSWFSLGSIWVLQCSPLFLMMSSPRFCTSTTFPCISSNSDCRLWSVVMSYEQNHVINLFYWHVTT